MQRFVNCEFLPLLWHCLCIDRLFNLFNYKMKSERQLCSLKECGGEEGTKGHTGCWTFQSQSFLEEQSII